MFGKKKKRKGTEGSDGGVESFGDTGGESWFSRLFGWNSGGAPADPGKPADPHHGHHHGGGSDAGSHGGSHHSCSSHSGGGASCGGRFCGGGPWGGGG